MLPKGAEMLKLKWKDATAVVLGVDQRNKYHTAFFGDLIRAMPPKNLVTQLQPDQPYFINTTKHYRKQWKQFMQSKGTSHGFLISPWPSTVYDLILNK
jgi:hypothetical protein